VKSREIPRKFELIQGHRSWHGHGTRVPPLGGVKQRWGGVGKTSYFRAEYGNISKTVGDTFKVTINDW